MAYKNMKKSFSFADLALESSVKNNRSIELMKQIKKSIDWKNILLSHYEPGKSDEGANAYTPLLLYKCLLLQKWFHINSDPELENQIYPVK